MTAISWTSTVSGDWSTQADWSPASVPGSGDAVTIGATGASYTITVSLAEAAKTLTISASNATLEVGNTLTMGGLLALGAGTLELGGGGVISGGTVAATGGTLLATGGTLDGVTYQGVLTLAGIEPDLYVEGGLTLETASGGLPGSIDLSGASYGAISVLDSETLNNATLNFGAAGVEDSLSSGTGNDSGNMLTLGGGFTVDVSGGTDYLGFYDYAYYADDAGDTLNNAGLIDVSAGELTVEYGIFNNSGSLNVDGGVLDIQSGTTFDNTGRISVSDGGVLNLQGTGTLTTAQLGSVNVSGGGELEFSGLLVNTGATLDVGTGSALSTYDLSSGGTIQGGTIVDSGSGLVATGGTLDGVTYQGVLTLAGIDPDLYVEGGLTLETASGGLPGSIDLSGASYGAISVLDSETLNNATLNFGAAGVEDSLSSGTGNDSGNMLTLGGGFTVDVSGGTDYLGFYDYAYYADDAGDTLNNAGLIDVSAGELTVEYGIFNNSGSLNVDGGVLDIQSGTTFDNTGRISVSDGGVLNLQGTGTLTTAQLGSVNVSGGGELEFSGLLVNTGATLDVGTGSALSTYDLSSGGTIQGGTIVDSGSGLVATGGTLDGVTYQGVLTLAGIDPDLYVEGGLTLETAAGGLPGSIDLSGASYGAISVLDSETLNNATLNFGAAGVEDSLSSGTGNDSGNMLTLGGGFTVDVSGGTDYLGFYDYAYYADDAGDTLNNAGLIDVSAGELTVEYDIFNNSGSLNVDGGVLDIQSGTTFDNTGRISVSDGGVLNLQGTGTLTTAQLGSVNVSGGGELEFSGLLVNTGATLDVGTGSALSTYDLSSGGTIQGGTIVDSGSGLVATGGTLDGVTYQGVLTLAGIDPDLYVEGGLTLETAAGGLPGSIDLSGASYGAISVLDSETLNNATLNFGAAGVEDSLSSGTGNDSGNMLTLGGGFTVDVSGGTDYLGFYDYAYYADDAGDTLNNAGLIDVSAGELTVEYDIFNNSGSLNVDGGVLDIQSGTTFDNTGRISVSDGGVLNLQGTGTLTTAQLGSVNVSGGGELEFSGLLVNTGATLDVGTGSALSTYDLSSGGTIQGGTIVDSGSGLVATGGTLDGVTYQGVLTLAGIDPDLYVEGGLTLETAAGGLPGSIDLSGASYGAISVLDSETLNNATLNFGAAGVEDSLSSGTGNDSGNMLTLGGGFTVDVSGGTDYLGFYDYAYYADDAGDTLNNAGLIDVSAGELTVEYGIFNNSGSLNVDGGVLDIQSGTTFDNTGRISVSDGGVLDIQSGTTFDNTGRISVSDGGELDLQGTLTTAQSGSVTVAAGATLEISGLLVNTGATLDVDTGSTLDLASGGTILGGTIAANGATLVASGGTLDGVTYRAVLALAGFAPVLNIEGGLTLETAAGGQPGSIDLSGVTDYGVIAVLDSETLNSATLNFGSGGVGNSLNSDFGSGDTLTLGGDFTVDVSGGTDYLGYEPYISGGTDTDETLVNAGLIDVSGGQLTNYFGTFDNTGSINLDGGVLDIQSGTFDNTGSISVSDGGLLDLQGTLTTAQLNAITVSPGGALEISGLLENSGATLDVGTGTALGAIDLSGTILGGTINDSGSGLIAQGGTLDGVTYQGVLAQGDTSNAGGQNLYIEGGLTLETAAGGSQGSIDLTQSYYNVISILDSETLNNATLNFGSEDGNVLASGTGGDSGKTLTLGSGFTIDVSGGFDNLGYTDNYIYINDSGDTLNNAGLINVSGGALNIEYGTFKNTGSINVDGGVLNILSGTTFTNPGSISVSDGGTLYLQPTTFTNLVNHALTGGTYEVGADSLIELNQNSSISTVAATIILSGVGSTIESYETAVSTEVTLDQSLAIISKSDSLSLLNGRNFTASHNVTDNGLLNLGGVIFKTTTLTISSTGTAAGYGTISATIANSGLVEATGGLLQLGSAVTGTGSLDIAAGAALELKGASSEIVTFNAGTLSGGTLVGGTLKIDTASNYTGTIDDFAPADTIDLANKIITSASVNGTTLVAQINGGGTQTYAVSGNFSTDTLKVASDGGSGTDLILYRLAQASTVTPNPVNFGDVHLDSAPSHALSITNTPPADGYTENLDGSIGAATGSITVAGSFTGLAPQATDSTHLLVNLVTTHDGVQSGGATITLNSDGTGVDGNVLTPLASQAVTATGTIYNYATASAVAPNPVNFGIVHVGDVVSDLLTITNTGGPGNFTENLDAGFVGTTGSISAGGTVQELAAGATDNGALTIDLDTTNAGTVSGTAVLGLVSDGSGIDTLGTTVLAAQTIAVTGTINSYATAQFEEISGPGTLDQSGTIYTLDLGTLTVDSGQQTIDLRVLNSAIGPADLLAGNFTIEPPSGGDPFTNTGIAAFTDIAAGQVSDGPTITVDTGTLGTFSETIVLDPTSYDADSSGIRDAQTLTVTEMTTLCFCSGTLIRTLAGEVPVENLAVGDMVVTWEGKVRPITWIGAGRVLATRGRRNAATPVIVRKGALADNVPHCDLYVTKGHSLYLDDVLIPVELLINYRSILWDDRAQEVELYHIELEAHDVLVANGAPAESYRDDGNRWLFRNANTGWDLPPLEPFAPVLTSGPVVDATWRRLLERAGPRPDVAMTGEPDLHLLADGQRINGTRRPNGYYVYDLPRRPGELRVVSRAGSPAELGLAPDPRALGVAVRQVQLWQGARLRMLDASDESLVEGFYGFESDNGFRWTDGDAVLPSTLFGDSTGAGQLVLLVGCTMQYPLFGEPLGAEAA